MKKMNGGLGNEASSLQTNRPMRPVTLLIIHCTATPAGREVSRAEVDRWHRSLYFPYIIFLVQRKSAIFVPSRIKQSAYSS